MFALCEDDYKLREFVIFEVTGYALVVCVIKDVEASVTCNLGFHEFRRFDIVLILFFLEVVCCCSYLIIDIWGCQN